MMAFFRPLLPRYYLETTYFDPPVWDQSRHFLSGILSLLLLFNEHLKIVMELFDHFRRGNRRNLEKQFH